MKIEQLSLFLENKPGHLSAICRALADAGINIVTLSVADTQQFGILRMVIGRWEEAKTVLEEAGFVVNVSEVVATEVDDCPGGLAEALAVVQGEGVNIEYMYAFAARRGAKAVLVFRFDRPDAAVAALKAAGKNVLSRAELLDDV